ncbi:flippase activity-associated protein Agl23 [Halegenticoccus tardaugens]|uniref:flippase activity-associated protein Agl23 n=1 Tax=Halegenticoccus tardaugens TaxID=2071624 RepID=UPI00100AF232|nr:flippase activity-associated protein Agl23 [Halegenticoccus tardaugens]
MSRFDDPDRRPDRVILSVCALAAVALAARLVGLGARPFHWDEGRVGYWTLRYAATGAFEYRPVAGGPFLPIVNNHVFGLLGASDFSARLVVALLGGLFPLVALLFRGRLRDDETVVLAAFLAANPLLLYYSRAARGDLPLAVFGLLAVGCAVRAIDADDRRYLYGGAIALGLALATSGFVVAYLACWTVAALLVFDHARLRGDGPAVALSRLDRYARALRARATPLARAFLLTVAVFVFFYAPRSREANAPDLWNPLTLPAVLDAALVGSVRTFYGVRVEYRVDHDFLTYVFDFLGFLAVGALALSAFAVVGVLVERYGRRSRPLVAFATYWGAAALLVFPVVTEVSAPWVAVHAVAPLAVPAAVGGAVLLRFGASAVRRESAANAGVASLFLIAAVAQTGAVVSADVYGPQGSDTSLSHYAQPADDLRPLVDNASAAMAGNEGVDVLYVGESFYTSDEPGNDEPPVGDEWGERLPLPWYFERMDAETSSVQRPEDVANDAEFPPVVVAEPSHREELEPRLDGYEVAEYRLGLWNRTVVVFTRA